MGPIPLCRGRRAARVSFTVTFDRPINPPGDQPPRSPPPTSRSSTTTPPSATPRSRSRSSSVTPVASSGVGPGNKFGYTEFTVTFNPTGQPGGGSSGIANYTGTYSYLITPDDGAGNPIVAPIPSFVVTDVTQPVIGPVASTHVPLRIPTSGTGGSGTADDITTSTLTIGGASTTRSSPGSRSTCR